MIKQWSGADTIESHVPSKYFTEYPYTTARRWNPARVDVHA